MVYVTSKKGNGIFSQLIQGLFQGGLYMYAYSVTNQKFSI